MDPRRLRRLAPLLAVVFAACGGGATTSTTQRPRLANEISVKMSEYKFEVSGAMNAGLARLKISNTGAEQHEMAFAPLKPGATTQQVVDAFQKSEEEAEKFLAGPPERTPIFLSPGRATETITDIFTPGSYALVCFLPAPDGMPHVAKGMFGTLEVKDSTPAPATIATDGEVGLKEYSITLPTKFSSGKGTFKVNNTGSENHNLVLIEVAPGKTRADVEKYFDALDSEEGPPASEPPAFFAGGTTTIKPGENAYLTLDLKSGTSYIALCVESTEDEKDHSDLGMITEFKTA